MGESGSVAADEVLGDAGLVVVATSAGEPVVVDRQLRPDTTVLAVGAHTVDTRELHEDVLRGAQVIVEDVEAARREAGDVVIAVEKGALAWDDVVTMAEVVRGEVALDPARRVVFKTVGMPWEDLAVARVVGVEQRGFDSASALQSLLTFDKWEKLDDARVVFRCRRD